jgi:hypothetical protein
MIPKAPFRPGSLPVRQYRRPATRPKRNRKVRRPFRCFLVHPVRDSAYRIAPALERKKPPRGQIPAVLGMNKPPAVLARASPSVHSNMVSG